MMDLFDTDNNILVNQLHTKYKLIKDDSMKSGERIIFQHWVDGMVDGDNKMLYEFKTTFGITAKQINIIQLMTFYSIGRWIVEEQQQGESRAKYGQRVIKRLSEALTGQYGRGFSEDTLKNARKFYLTYSNRISETVFSLFAVKKVIAAI